MTFLCTTLTHIVIFLLHFVLYFAEQNQDSCVVIKFTRNSLYLFVCTIVHMSCTYYHTFVWRHILHRVFRWPLPQKSQNVHSSMCVSHALYVSVRFSVILVYVNISVCFAVDIILFLNSNTVCCFLFFTFHFNHRNRTGNLFYPL